MVNLTLAAILELDPEDVAADMANFDDVEHDYSNGAICFGSLPSETSCQFSANSLLCALHHSKTKPSARGGNFPVTAPSLIRTVILSPPYRAWKCGGGCSS